VDRRLYAVLDLDAFRFVLLDVLLAAIPAGAGYVDEREAQDVVRVRGD
jgi:hypothetical protein